MALLDGSVVVPRPGHATDIHSLHTLGKHQTTPNEQVWVLEQTGDLLGYLVTRPVPGLPHLVEIEGMIKATQRRQGLGRSLLRHAQNQLALQGIRQLSYAVPSLNAPSAQFLQRCGFFVEHEEWEMVYDNSLLPEMVRFPAGYTTQTYPTLPAITHFRQLYELSFANTPAYQPYTSDDEVRQELERPTDLLFLCHDLVPVGFVWMRSRPGYGEIEPIGIIPTYQKQGHAHRLLQTSLHHLHQQNITPIKLGVWQTNKPAIKLYQKLGFKKTAHDYYLAYNL